jgi:hypothetical protein
MALLLVFSIGFLSWLMPQAGDSLKRHLYSSASANVFLLNLIKSFFAPSLSSLRFFFQLLFLQGHVFTNNCTSPHLLKIVASSPHSNYLFSLVRKDSFPECQYQGLGKGEKKCYFEVSFAYSSYLLGKVNLQMYNNDVE